MVYVYINWTNAFPDGTEPGKEGIYVCMLHYVETAQNMRLHINDILSIWSFYVIYSIELVIL